MSPIGLSVPLLPKPHQRVRRRRFVDMSLRTFADTRPNEGETPASQGLRVEGMRDRLTSLLETVAYWLDKDRWLTSDYLTLASLRRLGVTAEDCDWAAEVENSLIHRPEITPSMPAEEQMALVDAYAAVEARRFSQVWKTLANALRVGGDGLPQALEHRTIVETLEGGETEADEFLVLHWSVEIDRSNTPTLVIDADANIEIARRFLPQTDFHVVEAPWRNCRVTQILDNALSMTSVGGNRRETTDPDQKRTQARNQHRLALVGDALVWHAERVRGRALIVDEEAEIDERPLVAAYKGVGETLRKHAGGRWHVGHQGGLRGLDCYRLCAAILIAGRLQPRVNVVEDDRRALFFRDPRPLAIISWTYNEAKDANEQVYPTRQEPIRVADATDPRGYREVLVEVSYHPDPLCDIILRQIREAEISQSLARARLIHRTADNVCEVVIACNIPVPGVIVDRVLRWSEVVPDRFEQMFVGGLVVEKDEDRLAFFPDLFTKKRSRDALADRRNAYESGRRWAWAPEGDTDEDRKAWYVAGETADWWEISWTMPGKTGRRTPHNARLRPLTDETPVDALVRFMERFPAALATVAQDVRITPACLLRRFDLAADKGPKGRTQAANKLAAAVAEEASARRHAAFQTEAQETPHG